MVWVTNMFVGIKSFLYINLIIVMTKIRKMKNTRMTVQFKKRRVRLFERTIIKLVL